MRKFVPYFFVLMLLSTGVVVAQNNEPHKQVKSTTTSGIQKPEATNSPNIVNVEVNTNVIEIQDSHSDPKITKNSNRELNNSQSNNQKVEKIRISKSDFENETEEKKLYILNHPELYIIE